MCSWLWTDGWHQVETIRCVAAVRPAAMSRDGKEGSQQLPVQFTEATLHYTRGWILNTWDWTLEDIWYHLQFSHKKHLHVIFLVEFLKRFHKKGSCRLTNKQRLLKHLDKLNDVPCVQNTLWQSEGLPLTSAPLLCWSLRLVRWWTSMNVSSGRQTSFLPQILVRELWLVRSFVLSLPCLVHE